MANKAKILLDEDTQNLLNDLKYHPAILELRVATIYDELFKLYGRDMTDKVLSSWCALFDCEQSLVDRIVDNKPRIQLDRIYNIPQYRRKIMVMGYAWGESKTHIATHYFPKASTTIYRDPYVSLKFLNPTWIEGLKYTICVLEDDESIAQIKNLLSNLQILFRAFE